MMKMMCLRVQVIVTVTIIMMTRGDNSTYSARVRVIIIRGKHSAPTIIQRGIRRS
jgi:hypothetical protein